VVVVVEVEMMIAGWNRFLLIFLISLYVVWDVCLVNPFPFRSLVPAVPDSETLFS